MSNLKGLGDAFKLAVQLVDVVQRIDEQGKGELPASGESAANKSKEQQKPKCMTCLDQLQIGTPGHTVPCPKCVVDSPSEAQTKCATCKGKKKIGAKGHEVKCPACEGRGRS